jgi:hypothetical protein
MTITSIKDAIKALAQSLQVSTIFPAGLFILINAYVVLPQIIPGLDTQSVVAITLIISSALMLSYTFYAFNFPLIRLFEGHKLRDADVSQRLLQSQRARHQRVIDRLDNLYDRALLLKNEFGFDPDQRPTPRALTKDERNDWNEVQFEMSELERRLDLSFPSETKAVLATSLGNTIKAWEEYPRTRYGMDAVALWPRLVPLLQQTKFLEFVSQEKSVFDFLLNTCLVVGVLGLELTYLCLFTGAWAKALLIPLATIVLVYVLYQGLVVAAREWGTTVRVAFDLHRYELYKRLALKPTWTFEEERVLWEQISQFFAFRRKHPSFDRFVSFGEQISQPTSQVKG